jgi:RNA polymerase sigma-70 factor (ECF subfamily)
MSGAARRDHADRDEVREGLIALLPELRAFARFLVRQRGEADDLVQEAILRAIAARAQFRAGTSLRAWVFTILRNTHYEQVRRRRTERRVLEAGAQSEPGGAPAQHSQAELADLERLLWGLPIHLREAMVLVGARGLAYEEAALVCQVPVGTMKARVSRARARLARAMEGKSPEPE